MKKRVIFFVILAILIGIGGYVYYEFNLKKIDVEDNIVDEITEDEYEIVLPDLNSEEPSGEKSPSESNVEDHSNGDTQDNNDASNNKNDNTNTPSNKDNPDHETDGKQDSKKPQAKLEVTEIKQKYRPVFEQLEAQANTKIESLLGHAFSELKQKKQNGEDISYSYFYSKYKGAADKLEAKTDSAFYTIHEALEQELIKNGHKATEAKEFKEQYESAKSERRKAILNKALDLL